MENFFSDKQSYKMKKFTKETSKIYSLMVLEQYHILMETIIEVISLKGRRKEKEDSLIKLSIQHMKATLKTISSMDKASLLLLMEALMLEYL